MNNTGRRSRACQLQAARKAITFTGEKNISTVAKTCTSLPATPGGTYAHLHEHTYTHTHKVCRRKMSEGNFNIFHDYNFWDI